MVATSTLRASMKMPKANTATGAVGHHQHGQDVRQLPLFPAMSPVVQAVLFNGFQPDGPSSFPLGTTWDHDDVAVIVRNRLSSTALRASESLGATPNSSELRCLRTAAFGESSQTLRLLHVNIEAVGALRARGIAFVISKGPGISLLCRTPGERSFSDLDVLVTPSDFPEALRALSALGYSENLEQQQPWSSFTRYCREAINLRSRSGGSIDLHHHVPPWLWARHIPVDDLIRASETRIYAQVSLPLLPPSHNFIVAALHVVSDHNRPGQTLRAWRDLLILARASDHDQIFALAQRYRLVGWLRWIVGELPDQVRPQPLWQLLASSAERPANARRLRHLLPPAIGSRHMLGQALRLPLPNSSLYLAGMTVPSLAFLRTVFPASHFRYLRWWRASVHRMLPEPVPPLPTTGPLTS
jgi:Uncharacterised nucleotidyltransferase